MNLMRYWGGREKRGMKDPVLMESQSTLREYVPSIFLSCLRTNSILYFKFELFTDGLCFVLMVCVFFFFFFSSFASNIRNRLCRKEGVSSMGKMARGIGSNLTVRL